MTAYDVWIKVLEHSHWTTTLLMYVTLIEQILRTPQASSIIYHITFDSSFIKIERVVLAVEEEVNTKYVNKRAIIY